MCPSLKTGLKIICENTTKELLPFAYQIYGNSSIDPFVH